MDVLERLEKWKSRHGFRSALISLAECGQHSVALYWTEGRTSPSVIAKVSGYLSVNGIHQPDWHTNDKPATVAATIHAALDAALDAAENKCSTAAEIAKHLKPVESKAAIDALDRVEFHFSGDGDE